MEDLRCIAGCENPHHTQRYQWGRCCSHQVTTWSQIPPVLWLKEEVTAEGGILT